MNPLHLFYGLAIGQNQAPPAASITGLSPSPLKFLFTLGYQPFFCSFADQLVHRFSEPEICTENFFRPLHGTTDEHRVCRAPSNDAGFRLVVNTSTAQNGKFIAKKRVIPPYFEPPEARTRTRVAT